MESFILFQIDFHFNDLNNSLSSLGHLTYFDLKEVDSVILDLNALRKLYNLCGFKKRLNLLYRASVDGFSAANFHDKCDFIPNTLTVVKSSNNFIFGGFTSLKWTSLNSNTNIDNDAFLFSLVNANNCPEKMIVKPNCVAIQNDPSNGPKFGSGPDLYICNNANTEKSSYSRLDNRFACKSNAPKSFLAGGDSFTVSDIEVFGLADDYEFIEADSAILSKVELYRLYNLCEFREFTKWKLLYRASVDGFKAVDFHAKCDDVPNTLTVVKSLNNFVFGGFTSQTWTNKATIHKTDEQAFLFSLKNATKKAERIPKKPGQNAIKCDPATGANFCELFISDCSDSNTKSYTSIGSTYLSSQIVTKHVQNNNNCAYIENNNQGFTVQENLHLLAGKNNFQVSEIEVFALSSY